LNLAVHSEEIGLRYTGSKETKFGLDL